MFHLTVIAGFCFFWIASGELLLKDSDRIIGGRSASITDCPHLVSLQNTGIHFCGGSIISPTTILSAGHCIKDLTKEDYKHLTIRAGSPMWSTGGQVKNIVGIEPHPKYNPKTKEFDFALIKLGSSLDFNTGVKKIELADGVPADGKIGIICGWGLTAENGFMIPTMLKCAEVESISRKNCSQPPWDYGDEILPSMICAKGKSTDACQGDSGGPYVSKSSGKLWGVVSWGRGCARDGLPGVYAAVAAVRKWIKTYLEKF